MPNVQVALDILYRRSWALDTLGIVGPDHVRVRTRRRAGIEYQNVEDVLDAANWPRDAVREVEEELDSFGVDTFWYGQQLWARNETIRPAVIRCQAKYVEQLRAQVAGLNGTST
jgi:hypothetical protein